MELKPSRPHGKCPKLPWMIDFHTNDNDNVPNSQLGAINSTNYYDYLRKLTFRSKLGHGERLTQLIFNIDTASVVNEDGSTDLMPLLQAGMTVAKLSMSTIDSEEDCELKLATIRQAADDYSRTIKRVYPLAIALEIQPPPPLSPPSRLIDKNGNVIVGKEAGGDSSGLDLANDIVGCLINRAVPDYKVSRQFIVRQGIDAIFLTNIPDYNSIKEMKKLLIEEDSVATLVFATIQTKQQVDNIDELIQLVDGIIFDNAKLLDAVKEKFFLIQKSIIAKCRQAGITVIGSVDSDVDDFADEKQQKKSIVCDVANMIIDGVDGLLLMRNITLTNNNNEVLSFLSKLCKEAEAAVYQKDLFNYLSTRLNKLKNFALVLEPIYSLAIAAVEVSLKSNAATIIVLTTSGRSAKLLANFRPRCPIVAITRHRRVARQLHFSRGVIPLVYLTSNAAADRCSSTIDDQDVEKRLQFGITFGKYQGFIRMGDVVILLNGFLVGGGSGFTNNMRIVYASEFDTKY